MAEPLKNSIGNETVEALATRFEEVDPGFKGDKLRGLASSLDDLELKERINLIADTIAAESEQASIPIITRHEGMSVEQLTDRVCAALGLNRVKDAG